MVPKYILNSLCLLDSYIKILNLQKQHLMSKVKFSHFSFVEITILNGTIEFAFRNH